MDTWRDLQRWLNMIQSKLDASQLLKGQNLKEKNIDWLHSAFGFGSSIKE
jgi:hypothetical protein